MTPQRRYAYEWNTLPRYVYQNAEGNWVNFERDIVALPQVVNPVDYYRTLNSTAQEKLDLSVYDICLFYVFANQAFQRYLQSLQLNLFYYQSEYNLDTETEQVIQELVNQVYNPKAYQDLLAGIQQTKLAFRAEYEAEQREAEYLKSFGEVECTPFKIESVSKQFLLGDMLVNNIYAFFDQCTLSENFPLAVTPRFYKVLKGYEYTLEIPDEECMYLFSYRGKVEIYPDKLRFTDRGESDRGESDRGESDRGEDDEYLLEICECLGFNPENLTPAQEKYNGSCVYRKQPLNLIVWRDLVMNQPYISKSLVMDEHQLHIRDNRRKTFSMYYFDAAQNRTTLSLKIDEEDGLRLRILNTTQVSAAGIQSFIGMALGMYNALGQRIADEYNAILGEALVTFTRRPPVGEIDYTKPLKVLAPEMFLPNYTRKCGYLPRIVPRDVADELELKENAQIMEFPKPADATGSTGALLFTCEQHRERGYIFPGLRRNPLDNKDKYPLLPCCYQDDQRLRSNSLFNQYYDSDQTLSDFARQPSQKALQHRFLISDKFVGLDQTGKCSDEIQQWFKIYLPNESPFRKGVHRTPRSALECVLVKLDVNGFSRKGSSARLKQLEEEWERLRSFKLELCAQECWNLPNPEEFLRNPEIYFDPRYMIRLLEYAYQCKIILVGRTDFIHPNYIQGYLRWAPNPDYPVVVLYEHMGSESDEAEYPQCEILDIKDPKGDVFQQMYPDYLKSLETIEIQRERLESTIQDTAFFNALNVEYDLLAQHIDFYGKVYAINVQRKTDSVLITLFFKNHRVAPMHIPATNQIYYVPKRSDTPQSIVRIGQFDFAVYTRNISEPLSRLNQYDDLKMRTRLILENAKRLYALSRTFDFIRVSPEEAQTQRYSKYTFIDSKTLVVPTNEFKTRLINALKLFETRFGTKLRLYADADVIPFEFQTVQDFDIQPEVIIAPVTDIINWFSTFFELKPIDGTLYTDPFVCDIQGVIYKCVPISQIPQEWASYKVLFPQIKRTFIIGNNPHEHTLLVIQNTQSVYQFYDCVEMKI